MCGIAGGLALDPGRPVDTGRVARASSLIAHRGPDGDGTWRDAAGRVCLAHRRLAIIDLVSGQQPMQDDATGAVVIFNGEIYNYRELRQEMVRQGEVFITQSDTEVLLRLYLREGLDFVRQLRGMFAFAIWDPRHDRLLLARDRVGKKPLYHAEHDGCIYFASSFAAVRSAIGATQQVDMAALDEFFRLGYVRAPRTIHPSIARLPAGTLAVVSGGRMTLHTFWEPAGEFTPFEGTRDQAVDRLDELIGEAVALRLRSDVPLGIFLSGGVDSSLVAAVAARRSTAQILTFSIGFDELDFDERPYAAAVAGRIGSDHRAFHSRFDTLNLLPQIVQHYGEPFGDSSAIPTWLISQETRRHVTVALGGDGGDEGFGGYNWYRTASRIRRIGQWVPSGVARAGASVLASSGAAFGPVGRAIRAAAMLALDEPERFAALRSFVDPALARNLYRGTLREAWDDHIAGDNGIAGIFAHSAGSPLRRMRVADVKTYLADCLMTKVDVASMAHSLEVRAPLLDQEVLAFALSLPDEWITDEHNGKKILLDVVDRYLPRQLFQRRKQGFSLPLATWFVRELRDSIDNLPSSPVLLETGWFRQDALRGMVDEHFAGRRDHSQRLYDFLVLEEWLRQG